MVDRESILESWLGWYEVILRDFGYDSEKDSEAASLLASYMQGRPCLVEQLRSIFSQRAVIVAGASDQIEEDSREVASLRGVRDFALVAADGACSALLKRGTVPDVVVTDLDGPLKDLREAWKKGAILVVHAHGDNVERLEGFVPGIHERLEATCQCEPRGHIHNFGGFTDGDRAIFMASALGARRIIAVGMCLGCDVGSYSVASKSFSGKWLNYKRRKLGYAELLLEWLAEKNRGIEFIDATSCAYKIPKFEKMTLSEALR